jgi:hypothetical protein
MAGASALVSIFVMGVFALLAWMRLGDGTAETVEPGPGRG